MAMIQSGLDEGTGIIKALKGIITAVGIALLTYSTYCLATVGVDINWLLLSAVTVLFVSRVDVGVPKSATGMTLSDSLLFVSVLLYGTHATVVLAGMDSAVSSVLDKGRRKMAPFNAAFMGLSIFIASTLTQLLLGDDLLNSGKAYAAVGLGLIALLHYLCTAGLLSVITAVAWRRNLAEVWKSSFLWTWILYFMAAAAGFFIVELIQLISFYAFIVAAPVIGLTYYTYRLYIEKVEASNRAAEEVGDLHLRTIEALAIAIDAKDEVTHDHVRRVQIYSTGLARLLGLSEEEVEALKAGALLHDIGKLAVPDYILNKPGELTPAEFDKMKVHTVVGSEILERVHFPYPVVPIVRHHHERWDGRGYPDALRGDQIPMTARIMSVVDCFDAVREERQYRKAMTREQSINLLREGSGSAFDPAVVGLFLDHLDEFEAQIRDQGIELQTVDLQPEFTLPGRRTADRETPRAYDHIRSAHREVVALYGIAQAVGTSLDVRDTFAVFSSRLQDIVSYTTCVLYLVKPDSTDLEAAHVSGRYAEKLKGLKVASGVGIAGWVVANGHAMHNCDPCLDLDALKVELPEPYKVATVVPLVKDLEVLGALAIYSTDRASYEADDLRLVEAVAKLASDAIANAVHHEKIEMSALTDLLTGLPNARALRYRFEEEADRARRHKDTFTVLMMDVDGFKLINDQFGHQMGDQLLRDMVRLMQSLVRTADFITRYAGDEFVAIVQARPDEVHEMVQRIQQAIDRHDFGRGGLSVALGLSIGWACFGRDGDTLDELLLAADRSMYANKAKRKATLAASGKLAGADAGQYRIM